MQKLPLSRPADIVLATAPRKIVENNGYAMRDSLHTYQEDYVKGFLPMIRSLICGRPKMSIALNDCPLAVNWNIIIIPQ